MGWVEAVDTTNDSLKEGTGITVTLKLYNRGKAMLPSLSILIPEYLVLALGWKETTLNQFYWGTEESYGLINIVNHPGTGGRNTKFKISKLGVARIDTTVFPDFVSQTQLNKVTAEERTFNIESFEVVGYPDNSKGEPFSLSLELPEDLMAMLVPIKDDYSETHSLSPDNKAKREEWRTLTKEAAIILRKVEYSADCINYLRTRPPRAPFKKKPLVAAKPLSIVSSKSLKKDFPVEKKENEHRSDIPNSVTNLSGMDGLDSVDLLGLIKMFNMQTGHITNVVTKDTGEVICVVQDEEDTEYTINELHEQVNFTRNVLGQRPVELVMPVYNHQ